MAKIALLIAYLLIVVAALLFASIIALTLVITEDHPKVITVSEVNPETLYISKKVLKQIYSQLDSIEKDRKISISYQHLDGLFSLASDISPRLSIRYNDLGVSLLITISIKLPNNPFGQYLNITTDISNDNLDKESNTSTIGRLKLSNGFILKLYRIALYLLFDKEFYTHASHLITRLSIHGQQLEIQINPDSDVKFLLAELKARVKSTLGNTDTISNSATVEYYYDYLVRLSNYTVNVNGISLSFFDYLQPLYIEARIQSLFSSPAKENTAAILALALLVGDEPLRGFIKTALSLKFELPVVQKTSIRNRQDLVLHFIYSAVIKIFTDKGISISLGEIKEISDLKTGGSGFSFVDIAADRAGIKFAAFSTDSLEGAGLIQISLSRAKSENSFFPDILGLPEGLSQDQFNLEYSDTSSEEYSAVIAEIDRRIKLLEVYR